MKKLLLKALCLMLTTMMLSTMFVKASTTDEIMGTLHEETNIVDSTGYFQVDTGWAEAPVTFGDGKWTMKHVSDGNHGMNFRVLKDSDLLQKIKDLDNVIYTVSFDLHKDDMDQNFGIFSLGYGDTPRESSGIYITDCSDKEKLCISGPTEFNNDTIYAPWTENGTVKCTITYNSETKEMSVKAEGHKYVVKSILKETANSNSSAGYGIRLKSTSNSAGQISVSNVTMKIEQPYEQVELYGAAVEQSGVDNTHSDLKVTAFNANTDLISENGKYSQTGTVDVNENVAVGFKFNTNNIQDANNVIYTTSFNIHDDMGVDVTASLIRKSGTTGKHVLTFKKLNTGVRIYDATSDNTNYIDSSYSDGKAPCTVSYNAKTSVLTVQAGDKILTINDIAPETDGQYTTLRCKISDSKTGDGVESEQFTVSDVYMKIDKPNQFMGAVAENNNITEAATGDLQVIQWQQGTLLTDKGKFTLDTTGSGVNRGLFLGLPKSSSLKDTVDMTKVSYTASFKLHKENRAGNFTVQVMGYHSSSVESSGIVFMNEEKDGKLWINSHVGSGTVEWDEDGTVDCNLTYNAETKTVTVKVGEVKLIKPLTGDYNSSNVAAAYGLRITGPTDQDSSITISDVSLKLEQPIRFTAVGNMVSMPLYKPAGGSDKMIFASYSDDNILEDVEIIDVAEWTSENIANGRYDLTTNLIGNSIRVFLWDDFTGIKPLVPDMTFNF